MDCIIIDDDKVSRMLLEKYIAKTEFMNLLATFESPVDAINSIEKFKNIELIFLDVEMPEMTGIEFIKSHENLPQVIIVSAKENYAVDAIEYEVTDYLLKPISYARFFKAASKAKKKIEDEKGTKNADGIFIKETGNTFTRVRYEDIYWIEALENYISISTSNGKFTIHCTMKSIENQLPENLFIRIHRSFIVNISKIETIEDNAVKLKLGTENIELPIAKNSKDDLMQKLNVISK